MWAVRIPIGVLAGVALDLGLRAAGLHWLAWPLICAMVLACVLLQLPEITAWLRRVQR